MITPWMEFSVGTAEKAGAANQKTFQSLVGKTVRWSFNEGRTRGSVYEHTFNADGSVEYREVSKGKGKTTRKKQCAVERITPSVHVISYLVRTKFMRFWANPSARVRWWPHLISVLARPVV
jgi:hypothetical protein